ncbi:MAG: hypothetical protein K8S23_08270 [Candidatus Cloacimonetes bacterium]|nr:hypothetical protein [Candidatus Cloacimonadota bacterium]
MKKQITTMILLSFIIISINAQIVHPENVIISEENDYLSIEWDPVIGADFYTIYSSMYFDSGFVLDCTGTFYLTSWTAPICCPGNKFYYVRAAFGEPYPGIYYESLRSEKVGISSYYCTTTNGTDWNTIAFPFGTDYIYASDLGNDILYCDIISKWDSENQEWINATYDGNTWFNDFFLEDYYSYRINAISSFSIYSYGYLLTPTSFNLQENWNFVTIPFNRNFMYASDLGDEIGVCTKVKQWRTWNQEWILSEKLPNGTWINDFAIEACSSIMVYVTNNTTWPVKTPSNIQIIISDSNIIISWDTVVGYTYNVYSLSDPYIDFENWFLEISGITETSWSETIPASEKKFYYITAGN